jgi:hypothetical protein
MVDLELLYYKFSKWNSKYIFAVEIELRVLTCGTDWSGFVEDAGGFLSSAKIFKSIFKKINMRCWIPSRGDGDDDDDFRETGGN